MSEILFDFSKRVTLSHSRFVPMFLLIAAMFGMRINLDLNHVGATP